MNEVCIRFAKNQKLIKASKEANLMKTLLDNSVPVASSCGGDGICGKCQIQIVEGQSHLSAASVGETFLLQKMKASPDSRLSCQCLVLGDVTVDAKYW